MATDRTRSPDDEPGASASPGPPSFLSEYWSLLRRTAKWWILPLIALLVVLGALMMLSTTSAGPFVYTLF